MSRQIGFSLAIVAMCGFPAVAQANPNSATITASIPESCIFDAPALTVDGSGQIATGFALEACNSARRYDISASTRVLGNDEGVLLGYGSDRRPLEIDGNTVILSRSSPAFRNVPLVLEARYLDAPITVTLSMNTI